MLKQEGVFEHHCYWEHRNLSGLSSLNGLHHVGDVGRPPTDHRLDHAPIDELMRIESVTAPPPAHQPSPGEEGDPPEEAIGADDELPVLNQPDGEPDDEQPATAVDEPPTTTASRRPPARPTGDGRFPARRRRQADLYSELNATVSSKLLRHSSPHLSQEPAACRRISWRGDQLIRAT